MKYEHLSSDAKAKIDSLSDLVKEKFSKNLEIDFDALTAYAREMLSKKDVTLNVTFNVISTKKCSDPKIAGTKTNNRVSFYILSPEFYSKKTRNFDLAHEFGHLLLEHYNRNFFNEQEEDQADYFAEKISGYPRPIISPSFSIAKFHFFHPIESYREAYYSQMDNALRIIKSYEKEHKNIE